MSGNTGAGAAVLAFLGSMDVTTCVLRVLPQIVEQLATDSNREIRMVLLLILQSLLLSGHTVDIASSGYVHSVISAIVEEGDTVEQGVAARVLRELKIER